MRKRNTPTLICKTINFIKSLFNHIRTGMKKSSKKETSKRFDICRACEFFIPIENHLELKGMCEICGCNLSDKKILMNKLAWKDQKCPKDKW